MNIRTDLAAELKENLPHEENDGIESEELSSDNTHVLRIKVTNSAGEETLGKPMGTYITVEVPSFSDDSELFDGRLTSLANEISSVLPEEGLVLAVGLGNDNITPDALGPKTASYVFATRHIQGEIARSAGLENLRPVAVFAPGVLGRTGMETGEIIKGVVDEVKPSAVIVIDALASRNIHRLGRTVQIADTGISPGSGVGNRRREISPDTIGVPVISIGVPTVVDAATLACDLARDAGLEDVDGMYKAAHPIGGQMMVTPREIDLLVERGARLIAMGINCALHPSIDPEELFALVS